MKSNSSQSSINAHHTQGVIQRFTVLILFISTAITAQAQPPADPDPYPTLTALETVVIPPRDRVLLAQQLLDVGDLMPPPTFPEPYALGERALFRYVNVGLNQIFEVEARLRGLSTHLAVWVDVRAEVSDAEAQALADAFDTDIYPQVRDLWGSEATPGIDGDPRVHALFTYDLGGPTAYFSGENTFPREVAPSSNEREMFFFELHHIGTQISSRSVQSVMAHEFQHMIRHNLQRNMATWFNEGLSMYTEWYLGFPGAARAASAYQAEPSTQLNTWGINGSYAAHYGGALSFIIYYQDRFGLKALQHASLSDYAALTALEHAAQEVGGAETTIEAVFAEWTLANWWNDPMLADGRYGYQDLTALPTPDHDTLQTYPITVEARAYPYSATYYELNNLSEGDTLSLDFTAPATIPLVPTAAASGDWMWYSNRSDNSAPTLTRAFDLTAVAEAWLEYRVWYELEHEWDYGYVLISTDDGATWDLLTTSAMTDANPHGTAYGTGYTGRSRGWRDEQIALAAYAGKRILLRFMVITDDATNLPGMVIDDIRLKAVGYSSDVEQGADGWVADGWIRIDNRLPQRVWLQVAQKSDDAFQVTRWLYPDDADAMRVTVLAGVTDAVLVVSPVAPVTTISMDYTLTIR